MNSITITLTLSVEDAEPILRNHAELAATYSAWLDFITRKTGNAPLRTGESLDDARDRWRRLFVKSKRIVEAFGVEFSPTSEDETLTLDYPWIGGTRKPRNIGGVVFVEVKNQKQDFKHPYPSYRRGIHGDACKAAADRTVRAWHAKLIGVDLDPEAFNEVMAERAQ